MKIYVYAIAKNEEKHVKRWMNSVREADGVFVLDTGSEDNTAELLKSEGATVEKQMILPWRFDTEYFAQPCAGRRGYLRLLRFGRSFSSFVARKT